MNDQTVNALIEKLKALPPEQRAEVEDFVDFLSARASKRAALDRLLAIAPTLEAAGVAPMSVDEVDEEVKAVRRSGAPGYKRQRAPNPKTGPTAGKRPRAARSG